MEPLFEAKARFNEAIVSYNIFRIDNDNYEASLLSPEDANFPTSAPGRLKLTKTREEWLIDDEAHKQLGATLGIEIDVFNTGYGDLLGRIGVNR